MAFNSNTSRAEYIANSGQTEFSFVFKIYDTTDVLVYLTPNGSLSDDTADLLTITTDYTVTVDGDNGGEVTLNSGATLGDKITIIRNLPFVRDTDYQTNGDLLADTLNQDQNYQTYLIGDLSSTVEKVLKFPSSAQGLDGTLPSPSPLDYLRWNSSGTALENDDTIPTNVTLAEGYALSASASASDAESFKDDASTSASNALASETQAGIYRDEAEAFSESKAFVVDTIEALSTIPSSYTTAIVKDLDRGGTFIWSASGTSNGGTVFAGVSGFWNRQYSGAVSVKWFGAKGDEVTDDTVAIQSALTFCSLFGHRLLLSSGIYKITAKLQVSTPTNGFEILGESIDSTILKRGGALCSSVLEVIYADGIHINNFSIDGGYLEFPSYPVDENIGHGVAVGMSSNCVIKNIKVTNYRDSGIYCGHSNLPIGGSPIYGNNLIDNCMCLGNTTANNGIIYVSVRYSGITNCVVKDLKIDGVPAYGIQLKNACHHCWISDCSVFNSRGGFAIGQDQGEFGHIAGLYARLSNLHAKNCVFPYYFGSTVNAMMSNLICETTVEHTIGFSAGVILSGGSSGNNIDISIIGLVGAASLEAARPAVYFEDVSSTVFPSNNSIRVKTLSVTGDVAKTAEFSLYSTNNTVRVVDCLTHNLGYPSFSIKDLSPNTSGNAVIINEATCAVIRQITNDTVTIGSKFVNMVILDTEALANTDTLSTILGGYNGQKIVFTTLSNARDVTFATTGNISLNNNTPFSATTVNCRIELMYNSITSKWCEVSRSVNN